MATVSQPNCIQTLVLIPDLPHHCLLEHLSSVLVCTPSFHISHRFLSALGQSQSSNGARCWHNVSQAFGRESSRIYFSVPSTDKNVGVGRGIGNPLSVLIQPFTGAQQHPLPSAWRKMMHARWLSPKRKSPCEGADEKNGISSLAADTVTSVFS